MRIWYGVPPAQLCDRHLLGEHRELHAMVGLVTKGMLATVNGHIQQGQFHPLDVFKRHEQVVWEMLARGFHHYTPLTETQQKALEAAAQVFPYHRTSSKNLLFERCALCAKGERR